MSNFNFENYLMEKITAAKTELDLSNYKVEIFSYRDFLKHKEMGDKTIQVVYSPSASTNSFGVKVIPYRLMILTEANSMVKATNIMNLVAQNTNYDYIKNGNIVTKIQSSQCQAIENFVVTGVGQRAQLMMNITIFEMENIATFENLTIDGNTIETLSFAPAYVMQPDSASIGTNIAKSAKRTAIFALTLQIPCQNTALMEKVTKIAAGIFGGNEDFAFSFEIGGITFTKNLKLTQWSYSDAVAQIPSIVLSFQE